MRDSATTLAVSCLLVAAIVGCGSSSGVTTGSLFGSKKDEPAQVAAPIPVSPTDRLVQVSAVSARATRCGYYFDPEQLKASFLAGEEQAGTPPDQVQKMSGEYEVLRKKVLAATLADEGYCTEGRAREIKASLTRHLAGDFNPPSARKVAGGGSFLDTMNQGRDREVFVPSEVFNPRRKSVTRPADE